MDKQITPEVGMGATLGVGSDSYPYTIRKVEGKSIWVSEDDYKRIDKNGLSECQEYEYTGKHEDKPEKWIEYTLRKNGRYYLRGSLMTNGRAIGIGHRRAYQDPSF